MCLVVVSNLSASLVRVDTENYEKKLALDLKKQLLLALDMSIQREGRRGTFMHGHIFHCADCYTMLKNCCLTRNIPCCFDHKKSFSALLKTFESYQIKGNIVFFQKGEMLKFQADRFLSACSMVIMHHPADCKVCPEKHHYCVEKMYGRHDERELVFFMTALEHIDTSIMKGNINISRLCELALGLHMLLDCWCPCQYVLSHLDSSCIDKVDMLDYLREANQLQLKEIFDGGSPDKNGKLSSWQADRIHEMKKVVALLLEKLNGINKPMFASVMNLLQHEHDNKNFDDLSTTLFALIPKE
jgi:hypothetical protein